MSQEDELKQKVLDYYKTLIDPSIEFHKKHGNKVAVAILEGAKDGTSPMDIWAFKRKPENPIIEIKD